MNSNICLFIFKIFILTFLVEGIHCDARGWVDPSDPYAARPASVKTEGYVYILTHCSAIHSCYKIYHLLQILCINFILL